MAGRKYARTNLVAAQIGNHLIAPMDYKESTTAKVFEEWYEKTLMPQLSEGHVIIMDNASFHRKEVLCKIAAKFNVRVLFLPPYSPELNPIENTWANMKRWIRKNMRNFSSFQQAFFAAVESFSQVG